MIIVVKIIKKDIGKLVEQSTDATKKGCFRNQKPIYKIASFLQKSRVKPKELYRKERNL